MNFSEQKGIDKARSLGTSERKKEQQKKKNYG